MATERSPQPIPLAIVVVNYHCTAEIKRLLDSVWRSLSVANQRANAINLQVWIANNSLADLSIKALPDCGSLSVNLIDAPGNVGFGRACNLAISKLWNQRPRPWIWLLNPDTTLDPETLEKLGSVLNQNQKAAWAIAGTRVQTPYKIIEFNGGYWNPKTGEIFPLTDTTPASHATPWVSGCSLILNPNAFGDLPPQFDPDFFLYYEDFELCWRYGKKLRSPTNPNPIILLPAIAITHHTSSIIGRQPTQKIAWAIEGYLLALEKCAPRSTFLKRIVRIVVTAIVGKLRGQPGKWIGLWRYLNRRKRPSDQRRRQTQQQ